MHPSVELEAPLRAINRRLHAWETKRPLLKLASRTRRVARAASRIASRTYPTYISLSVVANRTHAAPVHDVDDDDDDDDIASYATECAGTQSATGRQMTNDDDDVDARVDGR